MALQVHLITPSTPLLPSVLHELACGSPLDEICNAPGSVRHHIYWHGRRHKKTNVLEAPMLFWIYQTGRHGPQNGFRLCLVHRGYHIASPDKVSKKEKEGDEDGDKVEEDDIDKLERSIPQGHKEVVILGVLPPPCLDV